MRISCFGPSYFWAEVAKMELFFFGLTVSLKISFVSSSPSEEHLLESKLGMSSSSLMPTPAIIRVHLSPFVTGSCWIAAYLMFLESSKNWVTFFIITPFWALMTYIDPFPLETYAFLCLLSILNAVISYLVFSSSENTLLKIDTSFPVVMSKSRMSSFVTIIM